MYYNRMQSEMMLYDLFVQKVILNSVRKYFYLIKSNHLIKIILFLPLMKIWL